MVFTILYVPGESNDAVSKNDERRELECESDTEGLFRISTWSYLAL